MVDLLGVLFVGHILYLQPIHNGCEIITNEKHVRYTTGMACDELGGKINAEIGRNGRDKERQPASEPRRGN